MVSLLIKIVIAGVLFWIGYRYLHSLLGGILPPSMRRSVEKPDPDQAVFQGDMVRDPVCNSFLVKDRAITVRVGDDLHYFCSEECRRQFIEKQPETPM